MKKILLLIILFGSSCNLFGQNSTLQFPEKGAAIAYYVWEEDEKGVIDQETFYLPFTQNYYVTPKRKPPTFKNSKVLINSIRRVLDAPNKKSIIRSRILYDSLNNRKEKVIWRKEQAHSIGSYLWKYQQGTWKSQREKSVLYFQVNEAGEMKFIHSSEILEVEGGMKASQTSSHFFVYTYVNSKEETIQQRVFQFDGKEITNQFRNGEQRKPERYLLFINGYRGPHRENDPTDNTLLRKDITNYWYKLDKEFDSVLKRDARFYLDASMSVKTSSHRCRIGFGWSYLRTNLATNKTRKADHYRILNTKINADGFETRKQEGRLAALSYLAMTQQSASIGLIQDTIDIVSHSMGYAYSLGLIEELQGKVIFGNYYAIAPESASYAGYDWTYFDHIIQFGSNLDQENADPVWEQDGVAPQSEIKFLALTNNAQRYFLPSNGVKKGFIDSHMTYSYHWIIPLVNKPSQTPLSK